MAETVNTFAGQVLQPGCEPACRACHHRLLSATGSEARKVDWLEDRLGAWRCVVQPLVCVQGERRWYYRDRVKLDTQWLNAGWQFGLRSGDELVPIPRCPVQSHRVARTIALLTPLLPPDSVFPMAYYIQCGAQVSLVLKSRHRPPLDWLTPAICAQLQGVGVEGLWLNLHPCAGRRLFAKRGWVHLWGSPWSHDPGGMVHGPAAFQQPIHELLEHALDRAQAHLAPTPGHSVVELYCGRGASLRRWCDAGAEVMGVELDGEAVDCARRNAPRAEVLRGSCSDRFPQLTAWCNPRPAPLVFANPPRTGLEPRIRDWIGATLRPARLAYLSCSAGTLSRDLRELGAAGYSVVALVPYDFFPQTYHVECLALLQR